MENRKTLDALLNCCFVFKIRAKFDSIKLETGVKRSVCMLKRNKEKLNKKGKETIQSVIITLQVKSH